MQKDILLLGIRVQPVRLCKGACRGGLGLNPRTSRWVAEPYHNHAWVFVPGTRVREMDLFVLILLERGGEYAFCSMVLPSCLWALEDDRRSVFFEEEEG